MHLHFDSLVVGFMAASLVLLVNISATLSGLRKDYRETMGLNQPKEYTGDVDDYQDSN